MNEIYWITRLDGLNNFFTALIVICAFTSAISFIGWTIQHSWLEINSTNKNVSDVEMNENRVTASIFKRVFLWAFPILFISIFCNILTPSTKDAYAIYGIGSTIDYIKSNETAKQLPDKCIEALSKYVDSINVEDKNEK